MAKELPRMEIVSVKYPPEFDLRSEAGRTALNHMLEAFVAGPATQMIADQMRTAMEADTENMRALEPYETEWRNDDSN